MPASDHPGCANCLPREGWRPIDEHYGLVNDGLRGVAIARIQCYQADSLLQCRSCGQHWLRQWWEFDTEATRLKEGGIVSCALIPLSTEEVKALAEAESAKRPLPHRHFRDGRQFFDMGSRSWATEIAES